MCSVANACDPYTDDNPNTCKGLQGFLRWFLPQPETIMVNTQARGVFLPYPLLALIVTLAVVLIGGLVTMQVQIANLSTTLLLRDQDLRAQLAEEKSKREELWVFMLDDRKILTQIQTRLQVQGENNAKR